MITIVIPNFNGKSLLRKNLPSVLESVKDKKNKIREIIIVDDGSEDDSVSFLKKNFPQVRLIIHKENRGFSVAVNTGVKAVKTKFVCLLNTDVIPQKDFLYAMEDNFKNRNVFGVSLNEKGYGPALGKFAKGYVVHFPHKAKRGLSKTFWVSGGSGTFRRKLWNKLGGLDDQLYSPFYWEDVDISYRALKRGYRVLWTPDAKVVHKHASTVRKSRIPVRDRNIIIERNQLLFVWKNITDNKLFQQHMLGLISRIISHPGYIVVIFAALRKIKQVVHLRRIEIKESKVNDKDILINKSIHPYQ